MCDQTEQAILAPLATLSLDKLAEFAIQEKLIDRFEVDEHDVTIFQGEKRFRLPERQASTFLIGMLRGRSWYVDDPGTESCRHPTLKAELSDQRWDIDADDRVAARSIEATLEALLTFTKDVGIIEGYQKNARDRSVHIDIPSCSSVFSYLDALGYLIDCVQHEIRSATEAASRGAPSSQDGAGARLHMVGPRPDEAA